jgi:hypothetical protein
VIWEISNPTGSLLREFVLGEEPAGFTSVVAFDGSLDVDKIRVAYSSDELDYEAEAIDLDNLREDQVYVPRRGHKTFEEYAEMTRCDKGRGPFT